MLDVNDDGQVDQHEFMKLISFLRVASPHVQQTRSQSSGIGMWLCPLDLMHWREAIFGMHHDFLRETSRICQTQRHGRTRFTLVHKVYSHHVGSIFSPSNWITHFQHKDGCPIILGPRMPRSWLSKHSQSSCSNSKVMCFDWSLTFMTPKKQASFHKGEIIEKERPIFYFFLFLLSYFY